MVPGAVPAAWAQDDSRTLTFFEPVKSALNETTPAEEWIFEGYANQVISLLVTHSGDLDPMIEVIGPDGEQVGENDDLDSLVTDAGLEALMLPAEGSYTVRVSRYGETNGEYELALTPGFARMVRRDTFENTESPWLSPDNDTISLAQDQLRIRIVQSATTVLALPTDAQSLDDFYVETQVQLPGGPSYAEFGLIFRAQGAPLPLDMFQFKVNTEGKWTAQLKDESGEYVLQTWTSNRALSTGEWNLGVLAQDSTFSFYANGALLGTVSDSRLSEPGTIGLLAGTRPNQPDPATIQFDDFVVTARLGTTYRGLPLALTRWDSADPRVIVDELAASGMINPAVTRELYVPETALMLDEVTASFELLGTDDSIYTDFVVGVTIIMTTDGQSVGCGMVYRWLDDRNLDLAYVDTAGGFGLVQASDGALTTNVYDLNSMVSTTAPNKLLVVAQGDSVAYYVNGALVAQEPINPTQGRVGVSLLNYEAVRTDCFYSNFWLWPLVG
jgi:hypothetical protein